MSRYIDIDKVLKELRLNHNDVIYIDKNDTAKRIEKIQGIDIVRCKECKWYDADTDWANIPYCDMHHIEAYEDGFCSYGERREP